MNSNILVRPIKTEKTTKETQKNNFTFLVNPRVTKHQIKEVVQSLFSVNVTDVHTIKDAGKKRRFGKVTKKLPDYKKAIVTLKEGQSIDLFETEKSKKKGSKKK